jgi:hypothetical protein
MRVRALALGLVLAGHARAASPEPYRIEYAAPSGCSSREAFVRELVGRTPLVRVEEGGTPAATYVVMLSPRANDLMGELVLRERDGRETRRALRGKTCDEVVSALAFIAAILVDPEAVSRTPTEAPRHAPPRPLAPMLEGSERSASSERDSHFRFGAAAGASLETSVSPGVAFGPFAELVAERTTEGARGLAFGLAFHRVNAPSVLTPAGRAHFTWTAARGWFCPLSLPSRGMVSFVPCGAVEGGTLTAEGSATIDRKTVVRPWLAFGPLARLELRPARFLAISLDGMAVFTPISHPTFFFSPDIEVFSVPVVGFASRAGIRAIFQ